MKGNVYDRADRAAIDRDPFPHCVVDNVLPEADYKALEETFPEVEYIAGDEEIVNNRTYLASSERVLTDPRTPEVWREFFQAHTQRSLFESAMALWQAEIERLHPTLEENFGKRLDQFEVGQRTSGKGESEANLAADVMLDCQFGVNSPVTELSSTRGPHVDSGAKLFSSLLYFRSEKDDSTGGEYELYRMRKPYPRSKMKNIPDKYIESVKKIPYRPNQLLTWINCGESIHGVTPRSVTDIPRRYVAISGECFGGARPKEFFSHFDEWDRPIQKLRAKLKV